MQRIENTDNTIPTFFHKVWLGSELPLDHAARLNETAELNRTDSPDTNYKTILWVDKSLLTAEQLENTKRKLAPSIEIHDVHELASLPDDIYRFMIDTPPNWGSASDLVRLCFLTSPEYGGVYLDTDEESKAKFGALEFANGLALGGSLQDEGPEGEPFRYFNNNFLAASLQNPTLKKSLDLLVEMYRNYVLKDPILMDLHKNKDRFYSTCMLSGPMLISHMHSKNFESPGLFFVACEFNMDKPNHVTRKADVRDARSDPNSARGHVGNLSWMINSNNDAKLNVDRQEHLSKLSTACISYIEKHQQSIPPDIKKMQDFIKKFAVLSTYPVKSSTAELILLRGILNMALEFKQTLSRPGMFSERNRENISPLTLSMATLVNDHQQANVDNIYKVPLEKIASVTMTLNDAVKTFEAKPQQAPQNK